jgi:Predicted membrane protein (DUF2207)
MLESLIVAAALGLAGSAVLARLAYQPGRAAAPAVPGDRDSDGAQTRPALVNLVLTKCNPGAAAYQATILDLAARGFLAVSHERGSLRVALAGPPAGAAALAGYEQQVLGDMRARLAGASGAPFEVVAAACTADVRGIWGPFEEKLRAEARRRGISRLVLPPTGRIALLACVITAAVAVLAFLAVRLFPLPGIGHPVLAAAAAAAAFWCCLAFLDHQERLTGAGSALAARWKRERADVAAAPPAWNDVHPVALRRRAFAVAARVPQSAPGQSDPGRPARAPRPRAGPPAAKGRPPEAWSSFSGTWRRVRITGQSEGLGMGGGVALLVGAAWLGVLSYALTIPGGTGPLPLAAAAAAVAAAVAGVRKLARLSALPNTTTFDGQVIARWYEVADSEQGSGDVPCTAVDDGRRAWTFSGSGVYDRVALGDLVRVTVNPRSRKLLGLTVTGGPWTGSTPGT